MPTHRPMTVHLLPNLNGIIYDFSPAPNMSQKVIVKRRSTYLRQNKDNRMVFVNCPSCIVRENPIRMNYFQIRRHRIAIKVARVVRIVSKWINQPRSCHDLMLNKIDDILIWIDDNMLDGTWNRG